MKKVLFITTISGFLPQFEMNDVKLLKEMGCEIHYASNLNNPIYTFHREDLSRQGIILHHIDIEKSPVKIRQNGKAIKQLIHIINENQIDLIHCHNPMGGVAGRVAAFKSKNKPYVIYTAHGFHFYQGAPQINWVLFYPVERFLAHFTNQIITINHEDYQRAATFSLRKNGRVTQIHSVGVDKKRFDINKKIENEKRKELGIPSGAFHIVTAAELNKNKNQRIIIEAIALLKDQNIFYSICGKGPNDEELQQLIRDKKLDQQVRLLGFRDDMQEILQTADSFAFPSIREGLGVAAVEALLCGVPLIVADNRGSREYAESSYNSIVCNAKNVKEFADAISRLKQDNQFYHKLKENSRKSAEKFSTEEVEKTMRTIYETALMEISE